MALPPGVAPPWKGGGGWGGGGERGGLSQAHLGLSASSSSESCSTKGFTGVLVALVSRPGSALAAARRAALMSSPRFHNPLHRHSAVVQFTRHVD